MTYSNPDIDNIRTALRHFTGSANRLIAHKPSSNDFPAIQSQLQMIQQNELQAAFQAIQQLQQKYGGK